VLLSGEVDRVEPILRDFSNIEVRDAVLDWDGAPRPQFGRSDGKTVETYPNPRTAGVARSGVHCRQPAVLGQMPAYANRAWQCPLAGTLARALQHERKC
jgi:hypothetical protein